MRIRKNFKTLKCKSVKIPTFKTLKCEITNKTRKWNHGTITKMKLQKRKNAEMWECLN